MLLKRGKYSADNKQQGRCSNTIGDSTNKEGYNEKAFSSLQRN
jgi:hypothetical protein